MRKPRRNLVYMFVGKCRPDWIGRLAVYEGPCTNWKGQDYSFYCDSGFWLQSKRFFNRNFICIGKL
jgi:hypothetical protein